MIKQINLVKAEIIYHKFNNSLVSVSKIYSKFKKIKFTKSFLKWRNYTDFRKIYQTTKIELEKNFEKKYEKDFKSLEGKIKEKEKENNEIKKSIQKNNEIESKFLKSISELEEKEINYSKSVKKLEEEKKKIQEEMEMISNDNNKINSILKSVNFLEKNIENISEKNDLYNTYDTKSKEIKTEFLHNLEEKIKDYEKQITDMKEENIDNDQKINCFMLDMSDLLQSHEKNSIEFI